MGANGRGLSPAVFSTAVVAASIALAALAAPAAADAPPCPASYQALPAAAKTGEYTCTCAPDAPSGSVWGSGVYTTDSSICTAAAHAGAILKAAGGAVTIKPAPGCGQYKGTTGNGIRSNDWGAYDASFFFPAKGDGACYEAPKGTCPENYKAVPAEAKAGEFSCTCPGGSAARSVWGSGIYTTDSSICTAAAHAGLISLAEGGPVAVKAAAGCSHYKGTTANGVTTGDWGAYEASFWFPKAGGGACYVPAEGACPRAYNQVPGDKRSPAFTCTCTPDLVTGSVWGSGVYTTDSSICAAAAHAGVIPAGTGGAVTVKPAAGCGKYVGTTANGITTGSWGSYEASFFFPDKGDGACAK